MSRRFSRARSIALDMSLLKDSVPFRALWIGQVIALTGTQMRIVAVPWQVFQITHSTVAVGLIGLVEVIPLILFSIWAGAIADRMDRRKMLWRTQSGLLVVSLALAAVSLQESPSLLAIYSLTAVSSALSALERPAFTSMIPGIVGEDRLTQATALRQVVFQTTQIVGPMLGGLMIAAFDIAWVYVIDAATFIGANVALRWVPPAVPEGRSDATQPELIREGLAFAFRTPLILSIFLIDLVAMVFGMPRAVFPALAERVFEIGPGGVGLLYSAPSLGALLAALTAGWVNRVRKQGRGVIVAVAVWGGAITLAGLCLFSLPLTLLFLALAGGADVVSAILRGAMLQAATPDHLLGRVSAANLMVVTGGPRLGDLEAGLVAGAVGAPASVVIGGVACLLGTAVVAKAIPALDRYTKNART
ncbi:MAG TPA: MFS transporter [Actinomycetota bacterium]|nr:MFS transporter [Actinomycetota bacterium]